MEILASGTIEQAASAILAGWRQSDLGSAPLPAGLRPKNVGDAYGIQQAVSRELGPVGGWRICAAEPVARLAAAPLPLAMFQPEPALLAPSGTGTLRVLPALALELGRSLPAYDAPFGEGEIIGAIGSTRPVALVLDPGGRQPASEAQPPDPLTAIAGSCGHSAVIYGRGVPGLPQVRSVALSVTSIGPARLIGRRRSTSEIGPVAIGDFIAPLQWLANFGAGFPGGLMVTQGGLTVRQMVVMALTANAIPIAPGASIEISFGELGKITLRIRRVKP
ncbi:MAG: hypothetical protein ACREFO_10770 [Acetobacteraceae bacterium]